MTKLVWEPKTVGKLPQEIIDRQLAFYAAGTTLQKEDHMLETQKYTRKPFDVEAVQVTAANMELVAAWCDGTITGEGKNRAIEVKVHRPQTPRQTRAQVGDWVLFAGAGFKVYLPKPFEKSFDPLNVTVVHPEVKVNEPETQLVELLVTTEPADTQDQGRPSPKLMPQRRPATPNFEAERAQAGFTTEAAIQA